MALGALFLINRGSSPKPAAAPAPSLAPVVGNEPAPPATASEQVEDLLEKAGQAMLDRRYMTPADNSALYFYRRVSISTRKTAKPNRGWRDSPSSC